MCHESIDQYMYCRSQHLIGCLPRRYSKRKSTRQYRKTCERIKNRTGLEQRPKAANIRRECGHWEADMIVGGDRQHGLYVLVDRKSRLPHLSFLENKTAAGTKQFMLRRLKAYPASLTQSITYDIGSENTCHKKLNETLGTTSFFVRRITVGRKAAWNRSTG